MECKIAEGMVNDYIDDKLSPKELEEFISHVHQCPSCYEELETYYIIRVAMKYLDNGTIHSYNIKEMLELDMHTKEQNVKRYKRKYFVLTGIIVSIMIVFALVVYFEIYPEHLTKFLELF